MPTLFVNTVDGDTDEDEVKPEQEWKRIDKWNHDKRKKKIDKE